ncbi:hypothetical protein ACFXTI_040781 [Malus domestica]
MKHLSMVFFGALLFIFLNHGVIAEDGFVKTRRMQLVLNRVSYYENGFNVYWLMYMATDLSEREKVPSAFREATKMGSRLQGLGLSLMVGPTLPSPRWSIPCSVKVTLAS